MSLKKLLIGGGLLLGFAFASPWGPGPGWLYGARPGWCWQYGGPGWCWRYYNPPSQPPTLNYNTTSPTWVPPGWYYWQKYWQEHYQNK